MSFPYTHTIIMAIQPWLHAARFRTLPLAVATTSCGCLLAALQHQHNLLISILIIATAVSLQIFSNFANDYGDAQNGADSAARIGPNRMVSSGIITPKTMKTALIINAFICCILGCTLLAVALPILSVSSIQSWIIWLLLGIASLFAAYCYTAGNKPYGYIGLGDVAVFLFFGWLAVLGSEYLHTGRLNVFSLLPASSMGLWCSMVLNLNNMRDIHSDLVAGKYTLAARLGLHHAKIYHFILTILAACFWLIWLLHSFSGMTLFSLQIFIILSTLIHLSLLKKAQSCLSLDKLLPQWSITVLLWVILLYFSI